MIGKTISHYKILEEIGRGGMGVVYKAEDTKLDRTVALKFLAPHALGSGVDKERFIHEAKAAASLNHPNICTIFEIDEVEDQYFIAMEHVEGRSLKEMIASGPLGTGEAVDIAMQVARGLEAAEAGGIVHRDIKSANIMVTREGQAKIMDFGLAKVAGGTQLTREGTTLGTVAYMSPEQTRGEKIDHRTDIWSLGIVLYEMVTGRQPFRGDYEQAVMYSILNDDPEPLSSVRTGVPLELERLVDKALSKDAGERYQHADGLMADLKRIKREAGSTSRKILPEIPLRKPKKRRTAAVITTVVIICAVVAVYLLLRPILFEEPLVSAPVPIAVISFENHTGDPQYDYLRTVIPNLLITSLEQSKYIRVATWERLRDLRKQIDGDATEIIDKDLGFELCRLDGIRAIAFGTFTRAGDVFVTDVKVLDVETKELLNSASSRGRGVGSSLETQIDELTREISSGIGLTGRKTQEPDVQIADVTTTSMEAYSHFLRGRDDLYKWYVSDALRSLEQAVAIDSTFAVAYLLLGEIHFRLGTITQCLDAYAKAKKYSGRATERERLYIEASYALMMERDFDKEFDILTEITRKFPKEKQAHNLLAQHYYLKGRTDEEIAEYEKVLELDPNDAPTYNTLAYIYVLQKDDFNRGMEYLDRYESLLPGDANPLDSRAELFMRVGRFDEAISILEDVLEIKPDFAYVGVKLGYCYALKENYEEALKWADYHIAVSGSKVWKGGGYMIRGLIHYMTGAEDRSLEDFQMAVELADEVDNAFWKTTAMYARGWVYYEKGEIAAARRHFLAPLESLEEIQLSIPQRPPVINYEYYHVFLLGMLAIKEGDIQAAKARLTDLESLSHDIHKEYIELAAILRNMLEAEILMARDDYEKAIEILESSPRWEIPRFHPSFVLPYSSPYIKDILARAYVQCGEHEKAIAEYEWLTAVGPERELCPLIHPLYHYRLALLYEETGRFSEAIERYERFLSTWIYADSSRPEISDARARLARLKSAGGERI
jgi:serine/threonine protein kinase/tetratricopeptide (TPR) repeat protein